MSFPLVERQLGIRLGVDFSRLTPGRTAVAECERRLAPETVYNYARVLWCFWLDDGRSVVSVPPGAGKAVARIIGPVRRPEELRAPGLMEGLCAALRQSGVGPDLKSLGAGINFACNATLLRQHPHADCRRLRDESVPPADGLRLPHRCFPHGLVFGVIADGRVASLALAHPVGVMEHLAADVGVETAPAYRGRGFAKAAVSALAAHVTGRGGEVRYGCRPDNAASIAVARALGFVPFGTDIVITKTVPGSGFWDR